MHRSASPCRGLRPSAQRSQLLVVGERLQTVDNAVGAVLSVAITDLGDMDKIAALRDQPLHTTTPCGYGDRLRVLPRPAHHAEMLGITAPPRHVLNLPRPRFIGPVAQGIPR